MVDFRNLFGRYFEVDMWPLLESACRQRFNNVLCRVVLVKTSISGIKIAAIATFAVVSLDTLSQ